MTDLGGPEGSSWLDQILQGITDRVPNFSASCPEAFKTEVSGSQSGCRPYSRRHSTTAASREG